MEIGNWCKFVAKCILSYFDDFLHIKFSNAMSTILLIFFEVVLRIRIGLEFEFIL